MPREHSITVYSYDELSEKAKEKARNWYRNVNNDDNSMFEYTLHDAAQIAEYLGITLKTDSGKTIQVPHIMFSGFWSQGDGASFAGKWFARNVSVEKLKEHAPKDETLHRIVESLAQVAERYPQSTVDITRTDNYYAHSGTMDLNDWEADTDSSEDDEFLLKTFPWQELRQTFREFADWIYNQLEEQYNAANADDYVAEEIVHNEYEFLEDGTRFDD